MNPAQVQVGRNTLKITQGPNWIEFASVSASGRTSISRYNLDGSDSVNVGIDGTPTTERATLKGRTLTIKSAKKVPNGSVKGTPSYGISKWELSRDLKTLTVHHQVQIEGIQMLGDTFAVTYVRE